MLYSSSSSDPSFLSKETRCPEMVFCRFLWKLQLSLKKLLNNKIFNTLMWGWSLFGWGTTKCRYGDGPWGFRYSQPSTRVKLHALVNTEPHIMCAVGSIHRSGSEMAPFKLRRQFAFDQKDEERTNPVSPNFWLLDPSTRFWKKDTVEMQEFWKVVGQNLVKIWKTRESVETPSSQTGVLTVKFGNLKYLHLPRWRRALLSLA